MPAAEAFRKSGTITASTNWDLDALDLSRGDCIKIQLRFTGNAGADNTDLLNCYLQNRWDGGGFTDRVALKQFDGTATTGAMDEAELQKFVDINTSQERAAGTEPGLNDSNHLSADTTLDGPFPRHYTDSLTGNMRGNAWRVRFVVTSGNSPSFPVQVVVWSDSVER